MTATTRSLLAGMLLAVCVVDVAQAAPFLAGVTDDNSPSSRISDGLSTEPLILSEALNRALHDNPEIAAARAAVDAGEAAARQAGTFLNPELSLEVENFAGSDTLRGFDGAETTLRLDQTLELGGKRAQRRSIGRAAQARAAQQQHLTRAEIYRQTVEAFMTLLAAQERLKLAETGLQLATQTRDSIAEQIEAGKASSISGTRTQPLLIEARLERERTLVALSGARQGLAALLGDADGATLVVQGNLALLPEPSAANPATMVASPQLALASAEREQAAQELIGEQLRTLPDLTLGLGVRRFEESGDQALVAGLSVPLPLFDRNRGGIAAASARLEQARQLERHAQLAARAATAQAMREFETRRAEAVALQEELLPAAQQSFEAVSYGYRAGKFGLLDLLDTQQQLGAVQSRLLTAQVDCHVAAARLDSLLGRFPLAAGSEVR